MLRADVTLAWRLLRRQWNAGELRMVAIAAVLAALMTTMLSTVNDRLEQALVHRAATLLGADLILAGTKPPTAATLAIVEKNHLSISRAVDFSTMLAATAVPDASPASSTTPGGAQATPEDSDPPVLLVSARAADDVYPLRGELLVIQREGETPTRALHPPAAGEIWVEPRVAQDLGVKVGDRVDLGLTTLRITALIAHEPDRAADFAALSPHVLFNAADLPASGVIQPGSRVRYRTLFSGNEAAIANAHDVIDKQLAPNESLTDVRGNSRRSGNALMNTLQFFALVAVLGAALCGAAIAVAADRHARRLYDTVALLRTFGMPQQAVWHALVIEVFLLALVCGAIGAVLGFGAQELLLSMLADILPDELPAASPMALLGGALATLVALPAFALPALARLRHASPLRVLRRDLPLPARSTFVHYGIGIALLVALVIVAAPQPSLAAWLLASLATLLAITLPLGAALARGLRKLLADSSLTLRLAGQRFSHAPWRFATQLVAFTLILATMTITLLLRDDLFATWQKQVPKDAPNVFVMNLLPHDAEAFRAALPALQVTPPRLYRVTPGRLVRINNDDVAARIAADKEGTRSIDRDLILTEAVDGDGTFPNDASPPNETSSEKSASTRSASVSVEEDLAKNLGIKTGDTLTFVIEGRDTPVVVTGTRKVDWNSFNPNFFMVLSPGALRDAPFTWLGSFRSDDTHRAVRALHAKFPTLTLIEVQPLLEKLASFISALSTGIRFVLALVLCAATVLLAATVAATLDERLREAALLRTLGARQALLRRSLLAEFALLGGVAGLLAAAISEGTRYALLRNLFDIDWRPFPAMWIAVPCASAVLLALVGWLSARRSLQADAADVLRDIEN